MNDQERPIVILGAGINGTALARELALNRLPVVLIDRADLSTGATAYASRLIHGGLRYLEFAEFDLVRESLTERSRLLQAAPQFVRPLELFIPVSNRTGGAVASAARFLFRRSPLRPKRRGLWLVRLGLAIYDYLARGSSLPRHDVHRSRETMVPRVATDQFPWLCSYYDAQMPYPERFVVTLLKDARHLAAEAGTGLEFLPYHEARRDGQSLHVYPTGGTQQAPVATYQPRALINATGAWVDLTLEKLDVPSRPLIGGTKGSHFITFERRLCEPLGGRGIYAEARDGRPIFVLPLFGGAMVGTTDVPYQGDPDDAVASEAELAYLLDAVNEVLPQARLQRSDIALHYCGVRPLPAADRNNPAGVTRRHRLERHEPSPFPFYSIIGGKLTTCRSLAEETAERLLSDLNVPKVGDTRSRPLPGSAGFPTTEAHAQTLREQLRQEFEIDREHYQALWPLFGTELESVLRAAGKAPWENVADTSIPLAVARWVIEHEWATTLGDLVERRLMLLYDPRLSRRSLADLAELLCSAGRLELGAAPAAIDRYTDRLHNHFGKQLAGKADSHLP